MCWAVSNISTGRAPSSSLSGGSRAPRDSRRCRPGHPDRRLARECGDAREMDSRDTRSSSTIVAWPPCSMMAFSSAEALRHCGCEDDEKPSFANFWAMAPPTPQRMPTGMSRSSSARPCASLVLRPSDCHFEVAPTTTATCLRARFMRNSSLAGVDCSRHSRLTQHRGKEAPCAATSSRVLAANLLEHLGGVLGSVATRAQCLRHCRRGRSDSGADDALRLLAVHHLVAVRPPRRHDLAVGIGQKRERKPVLRREFLVRAGAVAETPRTTTPPSGAPSSSRGSRNASLCSRECRPSGRSTRSRPCP